MRILWSGLSNYLYNITAIDAKTVRHLIEEVIGKIEEILIYILSANILDNNSITLQHKAC